MGEFNNVMGGMELGFTSVDDVSSIFDDSSKIAGSGENKTEPKEGGENGDTGTKTPVEKQSFEAPSLNEQDTDGLFDNNSNTDPIDVDPKGIFGKQEVVGSGQATDTSKDNGSGKTTVDEGTSSPAKSQVYAAALALLKEQGALPSLEDSDISNADSPDAFAQAIRKHIESEVDASIDADTRRVKEALEAGLEPDEIRYHEDMLRSLSNIDDATVEDDTDAGVNLRKNLIVQDFINRGFSQERAKKEAEKSISSGTDIEDAKEALTSNKEFFKNKYDELLNEGKEEAKRLKAKYESRVNEFKAKIDSTDEFLTGVKLDPITKAKIKDSVLKPVHKSENGVMLSDVQLYMKEHPAESQAYFAMLYTLTNGFKDMAKVGKTVTKRATSEAAKRLADSLSGSNSDTSARFNNPFDNGAPAQSNKGYQIVVD